MRPKSFAMLMLALGCGLVASIGITQVIANRNRSANPSESGAIFIAQNDIGLGEVLKPEMVNLTPWPKDKIPPGAISRMEDIDGRHSRTRLIAGEPILEAKLWPKGAHDQGAACLIPPGYRPVTVRVDLVSGGGSLILPGDRVDIMLHVVRDPGREIPETVTRTILQDVKVFAVNDVTGMEDGTGGGKSIVARTISLLVTPEEAARVTLASQLGSIQLVMRSPDDKTRVTNVQAKPGDLFGNNPDRPGDQDDATATDDGKGKGLRDFLGSMKNKSRGGAAPAADAARRDTWTMRVLKGSTMDEVQFEREDPTAASPSGGWRLTTVPGNSPAPTKDDLPAAEPQRPKSPIPPPPQPDSKRPPKKAMAA